MYAVIGGPNGRWIGPLAAFLKVPLMAPFVSQRLAVVMAKGGKKDLEILRDLIQSEELRPVIDRCYSLAEVPEAIRYLEQGHARGKVVVIA